MGAGIMSGGLSQRVLRQRVRVADIIYVRAAKFSAKPRRDSASGSGKPKLIAETVLYSLAALSPRELIVGVCDRPDTFACAWG